MSSSLVSWLGVVLLRLVRGSVVFVYWVPFVSLWKMPLVGGGVLLGTMEEHPTDLVYLLLPAFDGLLIWPLPASCVT